MSLASCSTSGCLEEVASNRSRGLCRACQHQVKLKRRRTQPQQSNDVKCATIGCSSERRSLEGLLCRDCQRNPSRREELERSKELEELRESNKKITQRFNRLNELVSFNAPWIFDLQRQHEEEELVATLLEQISQGDSHEALSSPQRSSNTPKDCRETSNEDPSGSIVDNDGFETLVTSPRLFNVPVPSENLDQVECRSISEADKDDAVLAGFLAQWSMNHQVSNRAITALLQSNGINFRVKPHVVLQMKSLISAHAKKTIELKEESIDFKGRQIPVAYASPKNVIEAMMIQKANRESFFHTPPDGKRTYNYSANQTEKHKGKKLRESSGSGEVAPDPTQQLPPPTREVSETSYRWVKGPLREDLGHIESPEDKDDVKAHLLVSADGGHISKRVNKTLIRYAYQRPILSRETNLRQCQLFESKRKSLFF